MEWGGGKRKVGDWVAGLVVVVTHDVVQAYRLTLNVFYAAKGNSLAANL